MTLQAILDSIDELPDAIKGEYKPGTGEHEGKFILDVAGSGGLSLGNTEKLHNALESERGISKSLKKKLEQFAIDGTEISPEDAIAALNKMKNFNPEDKEQIKKAIEDQVKGGYEEKQKELLNKYDTDIAKFQTDNEKLRKQLHDQLVTSKAMEELNKLAPESVNLLLPHVERQVKVVDTDDGKLAVQVINAEGGTRLSPESANNNPMTLSELVGEMSKSPDFASAFKGSGQSGSGSGGSGGTKSNDAKLDGLTGAQKLEAIRSQQA